jgi:hypothetical protein
VSKQKIEKKKFYLNSGNSLLNEWEFIVRESDCFLDIHSDKLNGRLKGRKIEDILKELDEYDNLFARTQE